MRRTPRFALLLLAFALRAEAAGRVGEPVDTIEWLVATADVVLTATVQDVTTRNDDAGHPLWDLLDLRVTRTLKSAEAHPPKRLTVVKSRSAGPKGDALKSTRDEYLYLLHHGGRAAGYVDRGFLADKLFLPRPDALLIPLRDRLEEPVFTSDFAVLTTPSELLAAVAREAESWPAHVTRPSIPQYATPPLDSPAGDALDPDSARRSLYRWPYRGPELRVPDGDRWKGAYVTHVMNRPFAYFRFDVSPWFNREFKPLESPAAVAALRRYLDDGDFVLRDAIDWPGSIPLVRHRFFYRRAFAADLLKQFDAPVPTTTMEPAFDRTRFPTRALALLAIPALLALLLARRASILRRLTRAFLFTTLTLSVISCVFWIRSSSRYDDVLLGTAAAEHEFSSCFGRLQYLYINDRPIPYGPVRASLDFADLLLPDHIGRLFPTTDLQRLGLTYQTGLTPNYTGAYPSTPANAHPYRLVKIPWWMPITLFTLPALLWAGTRTRAAVRRRARRRRNLCPACGYDLRATPACCPECGAKP